MGTATGDVVLFVSTKKGVWTLRSDGERRHDAIECLGKPFQQLGCLFLVILAYCRLECTGQFGQVNGANIASHPLDRVRNPLRFVTAVGG